MKPRRHARGLVMPPGRTIPRSPAARKPARSGKDPEVYETDLAKAAGELTSLAAEIAGCRDCERACDRRAYGSGYPLAPVMLVGERPSEADVESTNAFTGEAEALDRAFEALGVPMSWVYGSTAVRCGTMPATGDQIAACSRHLLVELEAVDPRVLVAFGPRAVDAVHALDGRCGISIPDELPQGGPVSLRHDLQLIVTEPLPAGVVNKDAKRRLWKDLQLVPGLLGRQAPASGS